MEGPSYANRDVEVERLREQVALLQRSAENDKELLAVKARNYITREDQVWHLITPEGMSTKVVMGIERGIGDHLILMRNKRRLPPRRE